MVNEQGNLSIDSENIFPIIKKWLYSDHDIFIRELVSNGCDAITKLKKLDMIGEAKLADDYKPQIKVIANAEDKTLKLIGYDQKNIYSEKIYFHNELSNHFSIMPSYFIETIPYKINNSIRYIIKITINESSKKPLILRLNH